MPQSFSENCVRESWERAKYRDQQRKEKMQSIIDNRNDLKDLNRAILGTYIQSLQGACNYHAKETLRELAYWLVDDCGMEYGRVADYLLVSMFATDEYATLGEILIEALDRDVDSGRFDEA